MIIIYILFCVFFYFMLGALTQVLMYLRRKYFGLPTNYNVNLPFNYKGEEIHAKFDLIYGKYCSIENRQNPSKNMLEGSTVIYWGIISFIVWIFGTFIFLVLPIIAYFSIFIIFKLLSLFIDIEDNLDFNNFINSDLDLDL